jgi:hypothetical protein
MVILQYCINIKWDVTEWPFTLLCQKTTFVDMQCDVEKTKYHLNLPAFLTTKCNWNSSIYFTHETWRQTDMISSLYIPFMPVAVNLTNQRVTQNFTFYLWCCSAPCPRTTPELQFLFVGICHWSNCTEASSQNEWCALALVLAYGKLKIPLTQILHLLSRCSKTLKHKFNYKDLSITGTLYIYTVKPLSIVPVTVVGPHVSSALFGPEISPI